VKARVAGFELRQLLAAPDDAAREAAWTRFLECYSPLLLYLARSLGGDYDAVMDRYAFILARLRRDDFRKLRGYTADGRATFATWLGVVARRLCLDHYRERFGRARSGVAGSLIASRRALANGSDCPVDITALPDVNGCDAAGELCRREIRTALGFALRDLDPGDRLLLAHWFEYDRSAAEIATLMGYATPLHVYRRVRSVCDRLRRRLEHAGIREARP
jgi:RNA polymerase sigma factor (sigma-70 family)